MAVEFGRPVFHYPSVDTTMRVAATRAREGCPEGTVVTADEQTAGRGRLGRRWESEPGQGLYLSLVLRPACRPDQAPLLTLVAGLAVKEAIEHAAGVRCDIRWPNDILIGKRKCCGILVEMEAAGGQVSHVVVGIGINVNQLEFPPALDGTATSLRIETGRRWTMDSVMRSVLESTASVYDIFRTAGAEPIIKAFERASTYACGRRVVIEGLPPRAAGPARGVTAGLSPSGHLLLRSEDGTVAPVLAGSVRPDAVTMDDNAPSC